MILVCIIQESLFNLLKTNDLNSRQTGFVYTHSPFAHMNHMRPSANKFEKLNRSCYFPSLEFLFIIIKSGFEKPIIQMKNVFHYSTPLLVIIILFTSCQQKEKEEKSPEQQALPNIILLMGDDHGWDEVGYNGHPYVKTPVLDEMSTQGLRFDRFYSGHPSCSPTRGSFMTGRHPNRYGTFSPGWSIRPEEITIASKISEAGYATAHFGKWHVGPVKAASPTNPGAMGFDEWLSHDNFFEMNPVFSRNGADPQPFKGESSQILIDETIKFIDKSNAENKPFMAVVWFGSPHEPYSGLPEDLALYDNLPADLQEKAVRLTSNETGQRVERPLRDVLRERYAEITAMDRSIGVLRDYLNGSGLRENTLLWYCGDNGTPPSAARTGMTLRGQKGTLYEGGIRVPGIIEWPVVIKKPTTTSVVSVTSDILPTLCSLADQPLPDRPLDGISLTELFKGNMDQRPEPLFFWKFEANKVFDDQSVPYIEPELQEGTTPLVKMMAGKYTRSFRNYQYDEVLPDHFSGERVVMTDQYKLVLDANSSTENSLELFDLTIDAGEENNLAEQNPDIVSEMQKQLEIWQQSVLESLTGKDY
jgi:arylsulfatase A-like enzyme